MPYASPGLGFRISGVELQGIRWGSGTGIKGSGLGLRFLVVGLRILSTS